MSNRDESGGSIKSLNRAAMILNFIGRNQNNVSLTAISEGLNLNKSTIHGLLSTLVKLGYAKQLSERGKYSLGLKLYELGQIVYNSMDIGQIAKPFLEELSAEYGETVHLAVLSGSEVLYLDKVAGTHAISMMSRSGSRAQAYCTGLGKALLSGFSDDEVREILRDVTFEQYTPSTVKDMKALIAELGKIRESGYAVDDEEVEIGLSCVAGVVRDHFGKVVAAVSVAGPTLRFTSERILSLTARVISVCEKISRQMGYNHKL